MINPKYFAQTVEGKNQLVLQESNRTEAFYSSYSPQIVELHKELRNVIKPVYELSNWPSFSLKKIKLLAGETLSDLLLANAVTLALEYKKLTVNSELKLKALEYYGLLATKKISLASPFFNGLRKPASNLSSCFIMEVGDNLESIMKHLTYAARISKGGGGIGVYFGKVRGKGAAIGLNKNAASSVMAWISLFDQICVSVNQLGSRPGAITVALPIWHIDIEEFLDCQTENGDLRAKAYNVQPQVCIDNVFMDAVKHGLNYDLYCPKTLAENNIDPNKDKNWQVVAEKLCIKTKTIQARKLWSIIQERQLTVGRPYIFFTDNAQANTPFKNYGNIAACNLCVESFSYFETDKYIHCCNLISINLAEHRNLKEVFNTAGVACEMADLSLNLSVINIPEAQKHIEDFRTIGIGLMGLADWLAYHSSFYSDLKLIEDTQRTVTQAVYEKSVRLAKMWGAAKAATPNASPKLVSDLWDRLDELDPETKPLRLQYGIRNTMMIATAPNTSTSLTMGSTASFLPPYSTDFVDESDSHSLQIITKYDPALYLTQNQVPIDFIIDAAAVMQKWTDAGISLELLLPKGSAWSSNKEFSNSKIKGWEKGTKCYYYIRSMAPKESGSCSSGGCSN